MAATPEKVTDEQATDAIQQLTGLTADGSEAPVPEPETPIAEPAEAAEPAAEAPADAPETAESPIAAAETDDVQSLRKRLDTLEAERKREAEDNANRLRAIQERHTANERILRDRHLRKSSIADEALRTLKAVRTEAGVPEAEVDRIIAKLQGTMNPDSASYAPPPEPARMASEDQLVTLNQFLNEKSMTSAEEIEFGKWLRGDAATALTPQEQAVAEQSLDGFLRLAHARWQTGMRETEANKQKQQADAAAAVKAAQRTQRAAARAATASPSAPSRPSIAAQTIDVKKLTKVQVSELMQKSVDEAMRGNY